MVHQAVSAESTGALAASASVIARRAFRPFAHRVEADFVFVVMDAWTLPAHKVRRADEIIERYGSTGASPYRVDVVSFTLEARHGLWFAPMSIKPKGVSKKKRTFGTPAFQHFTEFEATLGVAPRRQG